MLGSKVKLSLSLLGPPQIRLGGKPPAAPLTAKAQALLAYLAVEAAMPHQRDALAGLLWPDHPQEAARSSLRQAVHQLRGALGKSSPPFLLITRQTVQFNTASDYSLDVANFSALIRQCDHHTHRRREACPVCIECAKSAIELYRGDFLAGFFVKDSAPFEEWALVRREQLSRQALSALHSLGEYYALRGDFRLMEQVARRQIETDPFREDAHRQVMRALAWSGRRNAALAHYKYMREMLARELGAPPERATTALQAEIESDSLVPPEPPRLRNWPAYLTPFVGREEELAQISEYLQAANIPLLTIVGPGGIGKTRLALQAAAQEVYAFRDGVCFVPLVEISDPESAVSAIGSALTISFHDSAEPKQQLRSYLGGKDMLLVLDGLESLAGRSELLGELLRACPTIKILATSSEGLNLKQEWRLPIQGLSCPDPKAAADPEAYDAVQLFLQRARQLRPEFELAVADQPAMARICELVGGMPLALEVAAGWIRALSCVQIAEEIERSMDFLVTGLQDTPDRHRSVRAVFERSWNLLSDEEQQVLRQLAVFRGGFGLSAAEEIVVLKAPAGPDQPGQGAHAPTAHPLHALLSSLADKSLLQIMPSGRYEQHTLVRQYAEGKLGESAEEQEGARERHASYYASMLQRCQEQLRTGEYAQAAAEISRDVENVRAAWRWAVAGNRWREIGRCLGGLMLFYRAHGWWLEGEATMGQAVAAVEEGGPDAIAKDPLKALVLGSTSAYQGVCCVYLGQYEKAEALLLDSLPLLQSAAAGSTSLAMALGMLGLAELLQGKHEPSGEHLKEGLAVARQSGDPWHVAMLHMFSGHHARTRDPAQAGQHYRASLSGFQDLGDLRSIASVHHSLGHVMRVSGNLAEARRHLEESLALARQADARQVEGWGLAALGDVACQTGDLSEAQDCFERSFAIAGEIADVRTVVDARLGLGRVSCALHDYGAAKEHMLAALRMAAEARAWPQLVTGMNDWATWLAGQSQPEQERAVELLSQVLSHPQPWQEHQREARKALDGLQAALPEGSFNEALERGRAGTLEEAVEEITGIRCAP